MLTQQLKQKVQGQKGFTLLELLVVVAIMAFIVAMVAPRFAGITGGTVDVVCDTNQQRMVAALSAYQEQKGRLPSGMVNLVDTGGTVAAPTYHLPTNTGQLTNPDVGQATFFEAFVERNVFHVHHLNEAEARALRELGIGTVHNLNAYNYDGMPAAAALVPEAEQEIRSALQPVPVAEGLGVLMVGMGAADATANVTGPAVETADGLLQVDPDGAGPQSAEDYTKWGNPEWLGRIILGVGPDSALIREGMITAAGLCPGGVGNEQVFWNNYSVILPRLDATIARFDGADTGTDPDFHTGMLAKSNGGLYRAFDLADAQEGFMFLTQCPEGHRFPTPEEAKAWGIYAVTDHDAADAALAPGGTIPTVLEDLEVPAP